MAYQREIGRAIRVQRIRAGYSIEKLANKAGISTSYLSLLERGYRAPSKRVFLMLVTNLGEHDFFKMLFDRH